jgi:DNA-binding Xre family transcriptional regulator
VALKWRVGELAARKGWGARQLAERAGVDEKTARNIMLGKATRVDLDTIARLSAALGVWAGHLWTDSQTGSDHVRWGEADGAAGAARPRELDAVLGGAWEEATDPALERAHRHP